MTVYYLKATSIWSLENALIRAGLARYTHSSPNPNCVLNKNTHLDVIGDVERYDENGNLVEQVFGCHANLMCAELSSDQQALLPLIPTPHNPVRVFA